MSKRSGRTSPPFRGPRQPHVKEDALTDSMDVPGPGSYRLNSSFGKQSVSKKRSSATGKFGTAKRSELTKTYVGKAQAAKIPSKYTEETGYPHVSSIGKQSLSKKKSNPSIGFSKGERFSNLGKSDPTQVVKFPVGPSSMSKQASSKKKSSPSFGFGAGGRTAYNKQYLSKEAQAKMISTTTASCDFPMGTRGMGKQSDSRKKTMPSLGFGTSQRGHSSKLYQPPGF